MKKIFWGLASGKKELILWSPQGVPVVFRTKKEAVTRCCGKENPVKVKITRVE